MKDKKVKIQSNESNGESWQTINKGKPIFYKEVKHWIVYEFDENMLIAKNEDLTGVFCVPKSQVHV
jgi:hypothetical protein